ncbi:MAG: hypothetical protein H0T60_09945 [Acidobacteria bacterium]|nr:hypothetical protein [Acidobacteriota bacterium]
MRLPNVERAVVNVGKLRDYSLNPHHEAGQHKARVFKSALDITVADAEWLRERVLQAVQISEAVARPPSPFGVNYVVDILVEREERQALVRTAWIIEHGTDFPRLTSCYVL